MCIAFVDNDQFVVAQPNLDDAVFCRVNDHVGAVQAGES